MSQASHGRRGESLEPAKQALLESDPASGGSPQGYLLGLSPLH